MEDDRHAMVEGMSRLVQIDAALARAAETLARIPASGVLVQETGLTVRDLRLLLQVVDPREISSPIATHVAIAAQARFG